jgi:hypothetical protein
MFQCGADRYAMASTSARVSCSPCHHGKGVEWEGVEFNQRVRSQHRNPSTGILKHVLLSGVTARAVRPLCKGQRLRQRGDTRFSGHHAAEQGNGKL